MVFCTLPTGSGTSPPPGWLWQTTRQGDGSSLDAPETKEPGEAPTKMARSTTLRAQKEIGGIKGNKLGQSQRWKKQCDPPWMTHQVHSGPMTAVADFLEFFNFSV